MYSDTHFHFKHLVEEIKPEAGGAGILEKMALRNCAFGLDIGTRCDDLLSRQDCVENAIKQIPDIDLQMKAFDFCYFSAGIWPDIDAIKNRIETMKKLNEVITEASTQMEQGPLHKRIIAIGECGIDHHWNPAGVDNRCENDFSDSIFIAEKELFQMQLVLAKQMNLPVIVHSRDGFEDTIECIKNIGWNNGVIHCFSYGLEEAKQFLDLGWYISFSGGVTYTKRSKLDAMNEMLRYIPEDRILCETDSPYLAPVPYRGEKNNPYLVEHVYEYVAAARGVSSEKLSETVDNNIRQLFKI